MINTSVSPVRIEVSKSFCPASSPALAGGARHNRTDRAKSRIGGKRFMVARSSWFPLVEEHFSFVVFLDEHEVFAVGASVCGDAGENIQPAGVLEAAHGRTGIKYA